MKLSHIVSLTALFCGCYSAHADVYSELAGQIVANNASLKALQSEQLAEISSYKQDNSLADTEIEFENVWATHSGERKWGLSVSQSFDFPGAYVARNKELAARRNAFELQYKSELTDCVLNAYELLIEIAYCNKAIELEQSIVDDMSAVNALLEKAFKNGEATILELNRSKIELANNVIKLRDLKSRKSKCLSSLLALGVIADEREKISYPLMTINDLNYYLNQVNVDPNVSYYNELKKAELLGVKARKMESWPGISAGYVHEFEEGTSFNGFSVGLSLPFFSGRNKRAQAKALALQADWNYVVAKIERESVINVEFEAAQSNKELVDMLAPVFYNNNHVKLLDKAFKGGQLSAIDYLREVTYFRESEWDFLEIELNYYLSLVRLNKFQLLN